MPALQRHCCSSDLSCHSSTIFIGITLFKLSQHLSRGKHLSQHRISLFFYWSTSLLGHSQLEFQGQPSASRNGICYSWHSASRTLSCPHICGIGSWQGQVSVFSTVDWVRGASRALQHLCTGTPAHAVLTMEFNFLPVQTETYVFVLKYVAVKLNRILSLEKNEATP